MTRPTYSVRVRIQAAHACAGARAGDDAPDAAAAGSRTSVQSRLHRHQVLLRVACQVVRQLVWRPLVGNECTGLSAGQVCSVSAVILVSILSVSCQLGQCDQCQLDQPPQGQLTVGPVCSVSAGSACSVSAVNCQLGQSAQCQLSAMAVYPESAVICASVLSVSY